MGRGLGGRSKKKGGGAALFRVDGMQIKVTRQARPPRPTSGRTRSGLREALWYGFGRAERENLVEWGV